MSPLGNQAPAILEELHTLEGDAEYFQDSSPSAIQNIPLPLRKIMRSPVEKGFYDQPLEMQHRMLAALAQDSNSYQANYSQRIVEVWPNALSDVCALLQSLSTELEKANPAHPLVVQTRQFMSRHKLTERIQMV